MSSSCVIAPSPLPPTIRLISPPSVSHSAWSHAVLCVACNHLLGFVFNSASPPSSSAASASAAAETEGSTGAVGDTNSHVNHEIDRHIANLTMNPASPPPSSTSATATLSSAPSQQPPVVVLRPEALSFVSSATQRHLDFFVFASCHRRLNAGPAQTSPCHTPFPSRISILGTPPPPPPVDPSLSNIM